ncbi:MAG: RNA polymerase sigma factor [Bacteroidales bacterium]
MTEQQQIEGCKSGDSKAQRSLYDTFSRKMMGVCMRYCGNNRETAMDLLQDGFVRVFTGIVSYDGRGSLEGWIRKVIINVALDYIRTNDLLRNTEDLEFIADQDIDSSALDEISANELMEVIAELPDGFRAVFNMYVIEGYSHREIADKLGITESTSRSQLTRAKQLLQKRLKEFNEE